MSELAGFLLLCVAGYNLHLGVRIYRLLKARGTPEEIQVNKQRAKRLELVSAISLIAAIAILFVARQSGT